MEPTASWAPARDKNTPKQRTRIAKPQRRPRFPGLTQNQLVSDPLMNHPQFHSQSINKYPSVPLPPLPPPRGQLDWLPPIQEGGLPNPHPRQAGAVTSAADSILGREWGPAPALEPTRREECRVTPPSPVPAQTLCSGLKKAGRVAPELSLRVACDTHEMQHAASFRPRAGWWRGGWVSGDGMVAAAPQRYWQLNFVAKARDDHVAEIRAWCFTGWCGGLHHRSHLITQDFGSLGGREEVR